MNTVQFKEWLCDVRFRRYAEGNRLAILLVDHQDQTPVAVATVNVPDVRLEADEVLIKNFAENEGMVDALVAAGILVDTGEKVESGLWVEFPVCRLLVKERNG